MTINYIVNAGDGFVARITEPKARDLDGRPAKIFRNRKNTFALLVQAFCGALTKFWYFNDGWSGATNDITAYKQTDFYMMVQNRTIPP